MIPHEVLDLFAVPDVVQRLPGGQGRSVQAGDLVLSPDRDPGVQAWLSPVLARLAVQLDERPGRDRRDLRIAMPVPARDGSWVVDGWAASRFEAGSTVCDDLAVTLAAGHLFHAQIASVLPIRPPEVDAREDRWAAAERVAFGPAADLVSAAEGTPGERVVRRIEPLLTDRSIGRSQLVHADLSGNVLLDERGAPLVIDVAPAWRPSRWAEAVCIVDFVAAGQAPTDVLEPWTRGRERQAMLRAIAFRALSDAPGGAERYDEVLDVVGSRGPR